MSLTATHHRSLQAEGSDRPAGRPGAPLPTVPVPNRIGTIVAGCWRGRTSDPVWVRPLLLLILCGSAALYLIDLDVSGWANGYYSAAVQAGSHSWKAALFGSFDPSNFITVDKPPAALWVMDLSSRLFGLNPWSILVPQALEGVGSIALIYLTVRRVFGAGTGLLSATLLAVTPVATLMFRFNNPDALLTLLLLGATYAMVRSLESRSPVWMCVAGALVGGAFLTKLLQALLVVPVFAGVYLWSGPDRIRGRIGHLLAAGAVMTATAGWWVALVSIWPPADRPYIGSSQGNNLFDLIFGYNGFGRLSGAEPGAVGFIPGDAGASGPAGLLRMMDAQFRSEIGWFIPAAVMVALAALWLLRGSPRRDLMRSSLLLWTGVAVVTGAAISEGRGIVHPYYSLALAPSICAVTGIGISLLWRRRGGLMARALLTLVFAATVEVALWILTGSAPWSGTDGVLLAGATAGIAYAFHRGLQRARSLLMGLGLAFCLMGPLLMSLATASSSHEGAIPSAGVQRFAPSSSTTAVGSEPGNGPVDWNPTVKAISLIRGAGDRRWAAAVAGGELAAEYQLATGRAVMVVGGFNGTDPDPTLAAFESYARAGDVGWFVGGTPILVASQPATISVAQSISQWVAANFEPVRVGPTTMYDLRHPEAH